MRAHAIAAPALFVAGALATRALAFGWFGAPPVDARGVPAIAAA